MSLKVGELYGELGLDDGPFNKKLKGAGSSLVGGLTKAAAGAAVGMGTAIAGGVVYSLFEFAKLEKGMNEVFTLLPGISREAMGAMTDDVQGLSAKMGVMTDDMVPALYQALSAGVPKDNVFEFLETATKAGIAGVATTEDAVSALTTGMNIFGESAESVADALFTTVKLGVTTFPQLVAALGTVGPAANASGVSLDELAAAMATATKKIPDTAKVSTSLVQVFSELDKEGSTLNETLKGMGHQTLGSAKKEFGSFQNVLQEVYHAVGDDEVAFKNLFGSVEGANVALTMIGEGAEIAASDLEAMTTKAGASGAAFETMDQGLSRSMDKVKANVQVMVQKVGEALAPFAAEVAAAIEGAMPTVQLFSDRLNEIWDRKDMTISAKLEASWDEFGKLNETTAEIKGNVDGVSHAMLAVGHAIMGVANLFEIALFTGAAFGDGLVSIMASSAAGVMGSLNSIAGSMQALGLLSDEDAQKVQNWSDQTTEAANKVNQNFDANLKSAMSASDSATSHFASIGTEINASVGAFTKPLPVQDGGPLADVKNVTDADVEWLKADLAAGGQGMSNNLAGGMWEGKPQVDGAAGALRGSAASAGDVDLYSSGLWAAHGFASGLTDGSLAVGEAAAGLARTAINKANAELANRSPSKVMMKVGAFAGEGFAIGIENTTPLVSRASSVMARMPVTAGSRSGTTTSHTYGPTTIIINGARNPRAVAREVKSVMDGIASGAVNNSRSVVKR